MRNWRYFTGILVNFVLSIRSGVMLRLSEKHMNNSNQQRTGTSRFVVRCLLAGTVYACGMFAGLLHAAGEVTEIQTSEQLGTPSSYSINGKTYTWGMGQNQIIDGFTADSTQYIFASTADRVEIVRHDVNGVSTGNPCGVFVERLGVSSEVLKANYPSDGSDTGNCDMAAMLASRTINRGALDLFSNTGANPKNVERVDYIYDRGVLAPLTASSLSKSGHVVAEKRGNNPLQIAAITSVDIMGQPTAFGPLVLIDRHGCSDPTICYSQTSLRHSYSFFQNNSHAPQGYPSYLKDSTEPVGMAFVSLNDLGLSSGQIYYGFSYFADDVDAALHTLTDVTTFPTDTNDEQILFGDGADIYGGVAGYYLAQSLSVASGTVFKDENGDALVNDNEAGISDIGLTLYQDSNGNGVFDQSLDGQLGPSFDTDIAGNFTIPGLEDGVYFLLLDEADTDLPPALSVVPGSNPVIIVINGNDATGINFGFISDTGPATGDRDNADVGGTDSGSQGAGTFSDIDGDGIEDYLDNCPAIANADQLDTDNDGLGNACDSDDDGDGVNDDVDTFPLDNGESVDTDGDGTGNNADTDDDGDQQTDADEIACGSNPLDGNSLSSDVDGDNIPDCIDSDSGDAGTDAGTSDAGTDAGASDAGSDDSGLTDAGNGNDFIIINDGVNATKANPDSETVNHGSSATINVLLNDTDASGLGLTIISTSESANATIVIQDDVIIYSPEFGFNGMDSFLYVIEDGAGTRDTGTVSVTVRRFSDINNDGLNDFDQCDCDNLTIEVGVEGSALGGSSLFTFLVLWLFYGIRRTTSAGRSREVGAKQ